VPYTHFQLIAWELPTVAVPSAAGRPPLSGWDPGQECDSIGTLPVPPGIPDDPRIRLRRLAAVVDRAVTTVAGQPAVQRPDDVLKVFLVPEFYFRPPVTDLAAALDWNRKAGNSYAADDAEMIFDALGQMFVDVRFQHWLFVCGTVVTNTVPAGSARTDRRTSATYFNTAVIVRGGPQPTRREPLLIEKYLASHIDGVPFLDEVKKDENPARDRYKTPIGRQSLRPLFEDWFTRQGRVMVSDGITFGVEICLDHHSASTSRMLRRVLEEWPRMTRRPAPAIDLHVVIAGGMRVHHQSVAARSGGYLLRNDGLFDLSWPRSELKRVTGYLTSARPGTVTLPEDHLAAELVNRDETGAEIQCSRLPLAAGPMCVPEPPEEWSTQQFTQQLAYYAPVKLPAGSHP
jgi:hypothetical protein